MSRADRPALRDEHVAAVALAGLEEMAPGLLRRLVDRFGSATAALTAVRTGRAATVVVDEAPRERRDARHAAMARWRRQLDPAATRRTLEARRATVWVDGDPGHPISEPIPSPPAVLLAEGEHLEALQQPRVAIVGTRSATPHGLADARELAATLAEAGVTVVSGLAIGIDGAAHEGTLDAGGLTIGVVATGLDVVYPRRHHQLVQRVRAQGLVLGETGYGIGPSPGRFPVRNRIIAALADAVVVVEATLTGGARITAEHALRYDRWVLAVPGSRRNPAAAGTNALIADGAFPLTDWADLLLALGMSPGSRRTPPPRPAPDPDGRVILDALAGEPATPEQLTARTGLPPDRVALGIAGLERAGWVTRSQGCIWPR